MAESALSADFQFYLANQNEIVEKYDGKVVAIKAGKILGAYPDHLTAINETVKEHKMGTFLVQLVSPGTAAYTATYHSRVG